MEVDVRQEGGSIVVGHGPPWIKRPSPPGRAMSKIDYVLFSRDPLLAKQRKLSEWLRRLSWTRHVLVDLKGPVDPEALASEIGEGGAGKGIAIATSTHRLVGALKSHLPSATVLATVRDGLARITDYLDYIGADGASIPLPLALQGYAEELRSVGFTVYIWTVNDPEQAMLVAEAADALITDAPWALRRFLQNSCRTR